MNQKQYLQSLGIDLWEEIDKPSTRGKSSQLSSTESKTDEVSWLALKHQVATCMLCGLAKTRTQTVFGEGNTCAQLMIVGEAPGRDEDRQGKPFVGRAGQLLTLMLEAIGLPRSQVFIANVLKCRPPNNRDPSMDEVGLCTPYLQRQIDFIQPKLMVALGRIAAHFLLKTTESLAKLRGKIHCYGSTNTPLLVTYHPAYLLRSPGQKAKSYHDWRIILQMLGKNNLIKKDRIDD